MHKETFPQGRIQDFGIGVNMYKCAGVHFADFYLIFSQISHDNEIIWSH